MPKQVVFSARCRFRLTPTKPRRRWPILKSLVLKGRVVTGDAMFTNAEICREIVDSGGDYLLVVKDNQKN